MDATSAPAAEAPTIRRPRYDAYEQDHFAARDDVAARHRGHNLSGTERLVSGLGGAILVGLAAARRDRIGLAIGAVGGLMVLRGLSGSSRLYRRLGITSAPGTDGRADRGVRVTECMLIARAPEELYSVWRRLDRLPEFLRHLKSVTVRDERRSHWVAKAPRLAGGEIEWDAEIVDDEPGSRITWRSLPDSEVEHHGSVTFLRAPGDRGTIVRVNMDYAPPGGRLGHWAAGLFGDNAEQQIRNDLRNFKRLIEAGEILTTAGQPRGTCLGHGKRQKA